MGITYRFDPSLGVVIALGDGLVTPKDLAAYWESRIADRKYFDCRRILVDGRSSTIQFTGNDLHDLLNAILKPVTETHSYRIAILVSSPVQFGTARQFQVFFNELGVSEIFEDETTALAWLRS